VAYNVEFGEIEVSKECFGGGDKKWNVCDGKLVARGMSTAWGIVGNEAIFLQVWMTD